MFSFGMMSFPVPRRLYAESAGDVERCSWMRRSGRSAARTPSGDTAAAPGGGDTNYVTTIVNGTIRKWYEQLVFVPG